MKHRGLSEKELIANLRERFKPSDNSVLLGIGDDAAVFRPGTLPLVATKDMLIEGVHFLPDHPPHLLARKSLGVNLSDLAAMGARPRYALLGLGVPADAEGDWIERFFRGLSEVASEYDVTLLGGDITEAPSLTISLTLLGEGKEIVLRSGASPGDAIFVSGVLGEAALGLALSKQGVMWGASAGTDRFLKAFLDPVPQVDLGCRLAAHKVASAMIDISDGLSVDLDHICEESGVGAEVEAAGLPISPELRQASPAAEEMALHGGEDYQLLFTISPEVLENLTRIPLGHKVTRIGSITEGEGMELLCPDGSRKPLVPMGYQHFQKD
ncbi:MAG: thiamine-phosphate kinase [Candidatus Aminicenantaceae bacterium]